MYIVSLNLLKLLSLITISVLLMLGLLPGGTCSVGTAVPTATEHLPPGSKSYNVHILVINENIP